jgi:peroxiredoxin
VRNDAAKTAENAAAIAQLGLRTRSEEQAGASLSGHERDHLFLSDRGAAFTDIAGVSGLDDPADGRAAAFLDYDRDGWLDIALANANAPRLVLFRNRIGCLPAAGGRIVAVRFVGGNATPRPAPGWSARDGIGARVTVDLGDGALVREQRAGEGFATQNSATMVIGIGARAVVPTLTVAWPAGKSATTADVPAGTLLIVYENPAQSPTGEEFVREAYARPVAAGLPVTPGAPAPAGAARSAAAPAVAVSRAARRVTLPPPPGEATAPRLRLYSTMATWCVACRGELAQLRRLRETFAAADLAMAGVPIDTTESADQVKAWGAANRPPYALLEGLTRAQVLDVKSVVQKELDSDAVPATLITDAAGHLLHAQWGPPTLSLIRVLLAGLRHGGQADATPAATAPPACGE